MLQPSGAIVSPLVRQLLWTHNLIILSHSKLPQEREFYLRLAQHALTSRQGESAMAALKAARDTMNIGGVVQLMVVMSGSDRDKLLRLVNTNGAAFFGSEIRKMPLLGKDFVDHAQAQLEAAYPELKPIDSLVLTESFQLFRERPQFFSRAVGNALNPLGDWPKEQRFEERVLALARKKLTEDEAGMASEFVSLKPLEQVVLWRILDKGPDFKPYDADALAFYVDKLGKKVTQPSVQLAIDGLTARDPSLIWKSARGEYAVDDAMMHVWFDSLSNAGKWPPQKPATVDMWSD